MENFQEIIHEDGFQKISKELKTRLTGTDKPSKKRLIGCSFLWIASAILLYYVLKYILVWFYSLDFKTYDCMCGIKRQEAIGGNETIEVSPWMVRVFSQSSSGLIASCGGTIIASKYVLTAAHCCVVGMENIIVGLGGFYPNDTLFETKFYPVRKVIVHPEYDNTKKSWSWEMSNDIALLEMLYPIDLNTFTPVCLNKTNETFDRQTAEVIVYRDNIQRSLQGSVFTSLYNPGSLIIVCKGVLGRICFRQNWPGAREGDSGGPLIYNNNNSEPATIIGIAATVIKPSHSGWLNIFVEDGEYVSYESYTRISYYMDWIEQNMEDPKMCKRTIPN